MSSRLVSSVPGDAVSRTHSSRPEPEWRRSRKKRVQVRAIELAACPLIALLGRTLRWQAEGLEHLRSVEQAGRQPVMAFWHGRILPATWYFRHRGIVVITSENFDGEWIARIIKRFGYETARGSTSRGALRALLEMKRAMEAGKPVGFTVDGPRGPRGHAQPGAVWLARETGNPILPFHIEAAAHWTLGSWDRTQVPRPFSRMALAVGEPMYVEPGAGDSELEAARLELERVLRKLEARASAMLVSGHPG